MQTTDKHQADRPVYQVERTELSGFLYIFLQQFRDNHLEFDVGIGEVLQEISSNKYCHKVFRFICELW
jgi:hypothetical protein